MAGVFMRGLSPRFDPGTELSLVHFSQREGMGSGAVNDMVSL